MTSPSPEDLQRARMALVDHAEQSWRQGMSASEWEADIKSEALSLGLTPREVEAVWRLVWGIGGMRMDLS